MKSGAHLIIEHTEAMVVIDVNSGRFIGKKEHEDNSLKINIEAAKEIVRQLRLRDIGGLIVIDFIDLAEQKNRKKVYDTLKRELKIDGSKASLSEFSKRLDLGSYLILGKGEELNNGRNKTSTLCNLFEAVIGYMSIEIGINKTEKLLIDLFKEKIETIYNSKSFYDSKSLLQEKLQEEGIDLPDYVSYELEDGNFNVDLFIQNKLITSTKARRKIDAEKYAAQIALDTYINQDDK